MNKAMLSLLLLASACRPAGPPPRSGPPEPESPALRRGQPSPVTITATRDFTVVPAGDALAELCGAAASRVPLHYTTTVAPEGSEAAGLKRIRELERWVHALQLSAKVTGPAQLEQLYKRQRTILGHSLSVDSFARLRGAPPGVLIATFGAMTKGAIGPYRVSARTPAEEAFTGDKVIVRVETGNAKKEAELELTPDRIKDLREVKAELERLAATGDGEKLARALRQDLVLVAASGIAPTLTFDAARSRAARKAAVEQTEKLRMTFWQGQVVLKKGEVYTLAHRQILATMRSQQCSPCAGGLSRCAPGQWGLLRVGSITHTPIIANRTFRLAASGPIALAKAQPAEATPRVFVLDEKAGQARAKALRKLLDVTRAAAARTRWEKLRERLKQELQVDVIVQLLQSFGSVSPEKLRAAVLDLYGRAQLTPLVAAMPVPGPGEPCVVRRLRKDKISEEAQANCTVLPLARFRLQLPDKAKQEPGLLSSLPAAAQKAAVELVQELLVANTTFDAGETARRRKDPAPEVATTEARAIQEGDVLVQAGKRLTPADIYLLEQLYAAKCTRVAQPAPSQD